MVGLTQHFTRSGPPHNGPRLRVRDGRAIGTTAHVGKHSGIASAGSCQRCLGRLSPAGSPTLQPIGHAAASSWRTTAGQTRAGWSSVMQSSRRQDLRKLAAQPDAGPDRRRSGAVRAR